ncbi:MAG: hypothetical protein AB8B49_00365, partial [Nitratireductor sp.]
MDHLKPDATRPNGKPNIGVPEGTSAKSIAPNSAHDDVQHSTQHHGANLKHLNPNRSIGRYFAKTFRILLFLTVIISILLAGAYYLVRGQVINNASINEKVTTSLQSLVGENYKIQVEQSEITLASLTSASLRGQNVKISNVQTGEGLATLSNLDVSINPTSLLSDTPKIQTLKVSGVDVNLANQETPFISINDELLKIGSLAGQLQTALAKSDLELINVRNVQVQGAFAKDKLKRESATPLLFENIEVSINVDGYFSFITNLKSDVSNIDISAQWLALDDQLNALNVNASNVQISNWINLPLIEIEGGKKSGIGSDAVFNISAQLPFTKELKPKQPIINAISQSSKLRIGTNNFTQLSKADFNFRLLPKSNQIQIERSTLVGEGVEIGFVAGIIPADKNLGFSSALNFDLVAENIKIASNNTSAEPLLANALILGEWNRKTDQMAFDSITISSNQQKIYGNAVLSFGGKSSAIKGSFETPELSLHALKKLWPFFIAPNTRNWLREKTSGGILKDASLVLDIPKDRLHSLTQYASFKSNELNLTSNFDGVKLVSFGQVAPLEKASGNLKIEGSSLIAKLSDGAFRSPANNLIDLEEGNISFKNYSEQNPKIYLDARLNGKLSTTMAIANSAPLKAADKALVSPADLSGNANVDVVTTFNLFPKSKIENLDWNALITLTNASSDKKVFGHSLKNADMLIEITPNEIRGSGSASLNGAKSDISFVEPLGKNSQAKSAFNLATTLSQKDLKKQGLDLAPIVKGDLDVKVQTLKSGEQKYNIDLKKSDISLPWIGWFKGVGIPATAEFILVENKSANTLKNFAISGKGLKAKGNIAFNKNGLISADLKNVSLVGSENFNVKVTRLKSRYDVKVTGKSFDGRSVINAFLHSEETANKEPGLDVSLSASLSSITGFNATSLTNASVNYRTDNGLLSLLQVKGTLNSGANAIIDAKRKGELTTFDIDSNNAGEAFAFLDIYTKMQG